MPEEAYQSTAGQYQDIRALQDSTKISEHCRTVPRYQSTAGQYQDIRALQDSTKILSGLRRRK
jgi:hypothetical protein